MLVFFYAHEGVAHVVAGYGDASAAEVGVEDAPAFAGVLGEQPRVEGHGLLRGVDALLVEPFIALHRATVAHALALTHAVPHEGEQTHGFHEVGGGDLAVGK